MQRNSLTTSRTAVANRKLIRAFGTSLSFDGAATFVTSPITPSITGVSFGFWMYLLKGSTQQRVVAWVAGGPNGGFFVEKSASGRIIKFDVYNGASQQVDLIAGDIPINEWVHVVCTFKTNEAKIYINGTLKGTDLSCAMSVPVAQTLTLGRSSASSGQFFRGLMDQFVFQNTDTPWTQSQVNDLYYRGIVPARSQVVYNMNNDVNDASGNGNNGTLTSGSYVTTVPTVARTTASNRQPSNQVTAFDHMRGWNYSSNYLSGADTNDWFVETGQIPFDMTDIKSAGINCVKIYADENNPTLHLAALDKVAAAGLKALVLRFITYTTDYSILTGGANRTAAIAKFTGMITNLKSHPAVIGWGFGNENNHNLGTTPLVDWYTLLQAAIVAGKAIDTTRFYTTANQEIADIAFGDPYVPSIDIWGANIYRGNTLTNITTNIQNATKKPFILTEFGVSRTSNTQSAQDTQASNDVKLINEAESYYPIIRGWVHFKFTDTVAPGTVYGATAPQAQNIDQSRTKYSAYNSIKSYCRVYGYGNGHL